MSTFQDRIRSAFLEENNRRADTGQPRLTKTDLWKAAERSSGTVTHWFNGSNGADMEACIKLATVLNCDAWWLYDGSKPNRNMVRQELAPYVIEDKSDFSPVKRVKFKLSAGVSGYAIDFDDGETQPVFFRNDWFLKNGYKPEKLFAVRVNGDSMTPNLYDSDLVVVNTDETVPKDGFVYAANYEGELVIKRVRLEGGECWLDSDASDQIRYRPRKCGEGCFILGRVVYKQSERI